MIIQRINLISMCAHQCARASFVFIDPFIGAGLITGASSLLGSIFSGIFGSSSSVSNAKIAAESQQQTNLANREMVERTNASNRQIARETNETNLQLAERQNQWNIEQWNRENEYNSPSNQIALYREAGLNPVLAQGGFTPANQLQSVDLANQQIGTPMVAPQYDDPEKAALGARQQGSMAQLQMFRDAISSLKDIVQDTQSIKESESRIAKNESDVKRSNADISLINQQLDNFRQEFDFKKQYNPLYIMQMQTNLDILDQEFQINKQRLSNMFTENELLQVRRTMYETENDILKVQLKYADRLSDSELIKIGAQAFNERMQGYYHQGLGKREDEFNLYRVTHQGFDPHDITSQIGSQLSADASRYSSDKSFEGIKYSADMRYKETEYRVAHDYGKMLAKGLAQGVGFAAGIYGLGKIKSGTVFGKSFLRFVRTSEKMQTPINNMKWFFKP